MSSIWMDVKIKYDKVDERSGKDKTVTEHYLVSAMSFTEAEKRSLEEIGAEIGQNDFGVENIKNITPVIVEDVYQYEEGENWYKCTVVCIDVDEKSGKEKRIGFNYFVFANGTEHAQQRIEDNHKDFIIPWEVTAVKVTKIIEVFPYFSNKEQS